jgi:hypothetical protein
MGAAKRPDRFASDDQWIAYKRISTGLPRANKNASPPPLLK